MKYFYAYDKDLCTVIFKSFSNLNLAPTFGDSLKLASMSSATCKDNKRKRDCRNIGNAERRLNNLTNVWKYVVLLHHIQLFTSIHLNSYQNVKS